MDSESLISLDNAHREALDLIESGRVPDAIGVLLRAIMLNQGFVEASSPLLETLADILRQGFDEEILAVDRISPPDSPFIPLLCRALEKAGRQALSLHLEALRNGTPAESHYESFGSFMRMPAMRVEKKIHDVYRENAVDRLVLDFDNTIENTQKENPDFHVTTLPKTFNESLRLAPNAPPEEKIAVAILATDLESKRQVTPKYETEREFNLHPAIVAIIALGVACIVFAILLQGRFENIDKLHIFREAEKIAKHNESDSLQLAIEILEHSEYPELAEIACFLKMAGFKENGRCLSTLDADSEYYAASHIIAALQAYSVAEAKARLDNYKSRYNNIALNNFLEARIHIVDGNVEKALFNYMQAVNFPLLIPVVTEDVATLALDEDRKVAFIALSDLKANGVKLSEKAECALFFDEGNQKNNDSPWCRLSRIKRIYDAPEAFKLSALEAQSPKFYDALADIAIRAQDKEVLRLLAHKVRNRSKIREIKNFLARDALFHFDYARLFEYLPNIPRYGHVLEYIYAYDIWILNADITINNDASLRYMLYHSPHRKAFPESSGKDAYFETLDDIYRKILADKNEEAAEIAANAARRYPQTLSAAFLLSYYIRRGESGEYYIGDAYVEALFRMRRKFDDNDRLFTPFYRILPFENIDFLLLKAESEFYAGNNRQAFKYIHKIDFLTPNLRESACLKLIRSGHPDRLDYLDACIGAARFSYPKLYLRVAEVLEAENRIDAAILYYEKALRLIPHEADAAVALARLYPKLKMSFEGSKRLENIRVGMAHNTANILSVAYTDLAIARLCLNIESYSCAMTKMENARRNLGDVVPVLELYVAYYRLKDRPAARKKYEKMIEKILSSQSG